MHLHPVFTLFRRWLGGAGFVVAALLVPTVTHAQQTSDGLPEKARTTAMEAVTPPLIDGSLSDELWTQGTPITDFVQHRPLDGAPATEQTEVWMAFDSNNLYVAVRAHYSDPGLIRANRVDRDQIWQDDTIRIYLDPFRDQQRAYVFAVNGYGIQGDALYATGGGGGGGGGRGGGGRGGGGGGRGGGGRSTFDSPDQPPGDDSWNALFASAGQTTDTGWTAEMSIPFKSLRYPSRRQDDVHEWGMQIQRTILSKNESDVWSPVTRAITGFLRQMGDLDGMRNLSTSRNLELQPTVTAFTASNRVDDTSFDRDGNAEAGMNLKYGLTSNLTLDFTVNPDFSQIESDRPQIETNQRFPIFVPEQRPFFVEGQENFSLQAPVIVLHTRTIVDPRVGAKITGKVGQTLIGLLVADDEAPGHLDDPTEPGYGDVAKVFVGRARHVLYGDSSVGGIATSRVFGDSYSHLAGIDGAFRIGTAYRIRGVAMLSRHQDLEGDKNSGNSYEVRFDRQGRSLRYSLQHAVVDPGFRTDLGFVRRTDTNSTEGSVFYTFWPETWITSWGPQVQYERIYDSADVLQNSTLSLGGNVQFAANMSAFVSVNRELERYNDIDFHPNRVSIGGSFDRSRIVSFSGQYQFGNQIRFVDDPYLGRGNEASLTVNLRPAARLRSEVTLTTARLVDPRTDTEAFDVKILRALSTYQFTSRFLLRNITEYDTEARTLGFNLLATYRVNSGTAFFVGYDDHYEGRTEFDDETSIVYPLRRANRAVFTKLQLLFRY